MAGTLKVGGVTLASHNSATNKILLSDDHVMESKYFIQGKLAAEANVSGGIMYDVVTQTGANNPYFVWNNSLISSGFDVGTTSNDFKFTKKGIYFVGFSATFGHVTTNTSRFVTASIRGSGSISESTNDLARGIDQIAQADSSANDYGNVYVSLVREFNVNDLINFYTDAGGPATDARRWPDTHVSVYLVRPT